jgi:MFS superfamily sulfate permease-like transporter
MCAVVSHLEYTCWRTLLVSICCCSFMILFSYLKSRYQDNRLLSCVPDVLIVVVAATFLSYLLSTATRVRTVAADQHVFPSLIQPARSLSVSHCLQICSSMVSPRWER